MKVGYARVSTDKQELDLQMDALKAAGCEKIYTEKMSGSTVHRPELEKALDNVRKGDVLIVWKLDRLGRNLAHLIETVEGLSKNGVGFKCLTNEAIDTTTSSGKLVFGIFASLAEFEREMIRERTNAGLRAARARGKVGGRPKVIDTKKLNAAKKLIEAGQSVKDASESLGISSRTLYRALGKS